MPHAVNIRYRTRPETRVQHTEEDVDPTRATHDMWGGVLLAGVSTSFWVPVLAYVCSLLGAEAGLRFWVSFACVMFLLEFCLWMWLRAAMRSTGDEAGATGAVAVPSTPSIKCAR